MTTVIEPPGGGTPAAHSVTNGILAQAPALTTKGNNTGATADEQDLTVAQMQTMLSVPTTQASVLADGLATSDQVRKLGMFYSAEGDFGFVGDKVTVFDGAMTTGGGSTTLTCATSLPFVKGRDEGKRVTVAGAGASGAQLTTTIASITGTTGLPSGVAILTVGCSTTVTTKGVQFGTDNTASETAMMAAANNTVWPGIKVFFGQAGLSGASPATNDYGCPIALSFTKQPELIGIGSSTNHDSGDYKKGGGSCLSAWGTSSDFGTAFQAFLTIKPLATGAAAVPMMVQSLNTNSLTAASVNAVGGLSTPPTTGNMLIATVTASTSGLTATAPSGWSLLSGPNSVGGLMTSWVYYKVASSEPSSWTWILSGSAANSVNVSEITGVSTAVAPLANTASATSVSNLNTPVVTTVANGCLVMAIGAAAVATTNPGPSFSPTPGSTTFDCQGASNAILNNNPGVVHYHDTTNQAAAGNTTARTITASAVSSMQTYTVTLAPATAVSGQAISAPMIRDLQLDGRNGDQNQALIGIDMQSCNGFNFDNILVVDCLAIAYYLRVVTPGSALAEAKDATRGTLSNLRARMLDIPSTVNNNAIAGGALGIPSATITSLGVTLSTTPQTLNIGGAPTMKTAGYTWGATNNGYPVLINYTGATGGGTSGLDTTGVTALTGCTVSAQDAINAPKTPATAGFVVQAVPGNGCCLLLDGDTAANACCSIGLGWYFLHGAVSGNDALWGPAAVEFRNSDSWEVFNPVINSAWQAGIHGAGTGPSVATAINRRRKPGVRFCGSNTANTLAGRTNRIYGGSPGAGGVEALGVTDSGALLVAPSGPNYWTGQQMGNGEALPLVENGAVYESDQNGALQRGGQGAPIFAAGTAITTALALIPGSVLWLPTNGIQVGTTIDYEFVFDQTNTAAAGALFKCFIGDGSVTVSAGNILFATFTGPTASVSAGTVLVVKIHLTFRTLGAGTTATAYGTLTFQQGTAAGFGGAVLSGAIKGTMAGFAVPVSAASAGSVGSFAGPTAICAGFIGAAGASYVPQQVNVNVVHPGPR